MDRTDTQHWFAMRATYRREMKAHDELKEAGIEVFIPMHITKKKVGERMKRVEAPAIHGLIFVHCSQPFIQQFKLKRPYLQYMCSFHHDGTRKPIIVPDQQMQDFIRISTQTDEVTYIDPETTRLPLGTRVVIVNGPFEGMKGTLQRIQGHRNRQFVIQIEGVLALAIQISPNQIEVLPNNAK
ncbi:MAG: UpxY family transcription antiterminator [Bacteroidaceae bacterium]|nr:UpxY family transcription antiterminator [Bacteroidaceae bacterium]